MNITSEAKAEERFENDFLNQFYFQPICAQEAQIKLLYIKGQAKTSLARGYFQTLVFLFCCCRSQFEKFVENLYLT